MEYVATGETQKGLTGSDSLYRVCHVRKLGSGQLRFQGYSEGIQWETDAKVSKALADYIGKVEHTRKSVAGTATMYAVCLMRQDKETVRVRVQVAGPKPTAPEMEKGAREWGVVVLLANNKLYKLAGV